MMMLGKGSTSQGGLSTGTAAPRKWPHHQPDGCTLRMFSGTWS